MLLKVSFPTLGEFTPIARGGHGEEASPQIQEWMELLRTHTTGFVEIDTPTKKEIDKIRSQIIWAGKRMKIKIRTRSGYVRHKFGIRWY